MQRFELEIEEIETKEKWIEEYVKDKDPKEYARQIIKNFNETLCTGESSRKCLGIKVLDGNVKEHKWKEVALRPKLFKRSCSWVKVECCRCKITGIKIGGKITRDEKFASKKYAYCRDIKNEKDN